MDHAGAVLGPLTAWWLLRSGSADVRSVIAWSLAPGMAVLVLAVWAVKGGEGRWRAVEANAGAAPLSPPSTALARLRPPLALLAIAFFYLLRMPETLMILRSQQLGVSTAAVLLLWAALHVVRSSASFAGGRLTDRIGASRTMWLGWLCYAAIAAGLTESPERALIAQFAGGRQGSGFGHYHGVTGLAALAGGIGLGAVFQGYGAGPAFLGSAAGGLALVLAWPLVGRRRVI